MSDFLAELHKEQFEFSREPTVEIMMEVPTEVNITMGVDARALLNANVERNVVLAIQGYTDWLACELVRSNNFKKQPMPLFVRRDILESISMKCGVPADFINSLLIYRFHKSAKWPLLGEVTSEGDLIPDEVALKQWATFFDWSK